MCGLHANADTTSNTGCTGAVRLLSNSLRTAAQNNTRE
jgi:hypothetical protein